MKYPIPILFLLSCAATSQIPCPPQKIIRDTIQLPPIVQTEFIIRDTAIPQGAIIVYPVAGDNYTNLQSAITYAVKTGSTMRLMPGEYPYTHPLLAIDFNGTDFRQISFQMIGPVSCKASNSIGQAVLKPLFNNAPAIIIQRGKGVKIENIAEIGPFTFTNNLSQIQIQTLKFSQWNDGSIRQNKYSPQGFAAVDPFCDSSYISSTDRYPGLEKYYAGGMSRAGSTGVQFIGCRAINNVVGIIFEPSFQQNGDCSDVIDCDIEYCRSAIAYTQQQSKENHVIRLKSWGHTNTIIDCQNYGSGMGVMPYIDGMNIAGGTYQIFACGNADFQGAARNIYAELIFKIGTVSGYQSTLIESLTADFTTDGPTPDFIISGNANLEDAHLRYYDNTERRLILSNFCGSFHYGDLDTVPIIGSVNNSGVGYCKPNFNYVNLAQGQGPPSDRPKLNSTNEIDQYIGTVNVTIDTVSWTATAPVNVPNGAYVVVPSLANGSWQLGKYNGSVFEHTCSSLRSGVYDLYLVK